jgi:sulfur carrier protein ThiS
MNKIRIQLYSWISQTLGMPFAGDCVLDKEVKEGASISDLFSELAGDCPEFRKKVFNPETCEMSDQVLVILNDIFLPTGEIAGTKLNNLDIITLTPVMFGG